MGIFNGNNLSVEAILTTRGRELLSKDSGKLNITKFALGDEEIDYTLFDETHPNGDASFGNVIENSTPIEASPTRQNLKSYLVPQNESFENRKLIVPPDVTLQPNTSFVVNPNTRYGGVEIFESYLFSFLFGESRFDPCPRTNGTFFNIVPSSRTVFSPKKYHLKMEIVPDFFGK